MRHKLFLFLLIFLSHLTSVAQNPTFSVATVNVDGLPASILFFNINKEGPGATYTPYISQYLAIQDFDFIGVQENFDFNTELHSALDDCYNSDEWSGGVYASGGNFSLFNMKFPCDGLNAFWKKNITVTSTTRYAWWKNCGKLNHASDDLVTKGFRRHEVEFSDGFKMLIYNMHMDASSESDEETGNDAEDREVRRTQWITLCDDIIERLDNRPIIVMGDLNSYYERDSIKTLFINKIIGTGRATANDTWIELERGGIYPTIKEGPVMADNRKGWTRNGEALDKIIYINPLEGDMHLRALSIKIHDKDYHREDPDEPLGDHFPLSARFERILGDINGLEVPTFIEQTETEAIFDLQGHRHTHLQRGINIVRTKDGRVMKIMR